MKNKLKRVVFRCGEPGRPEGGAQKDKVNYMEKNYYT